MVTTRERRWRWDRRVETIDHRPARTKEACAIAVRPADEEGIVHDHLFPRAAAIIAKRLFASPSLVSTQIGAQLQSRRGAGRGAVT
jgi:hypothetical protein